MFPVNPVLYTEADDDDDEEEEEEEEEFCSDFIFKNGVDPTLTEETVPLEQCFL